PAEIGFPVVSESSTVTMPPQPFSSLPKSAPELRRTTSGSSVPFGLMSEIESADVCGVPIRNETRTNEIGPLSGTSIAWSRRSPIRTLTLPVEYSFVAACAGAAAGAIRTRARSARRLIAALAVVDDVVRVAQGLDRVLGLLERRLRDQHLLR